MISKASSQAPKVKKILVAVDGSAPSTRGIEHAVQMAKEKMLTSLRFMWIHPTKIWIREDTVLMCC
jgi:nucleotide-binding universal stress UspA family protein